MKKKILFVVSSASIIGPLNRKTGNLLTEVAHPYEAFKKQGYDIDIYSVKGGDAPIDLVELEDPVNIEFLAGDGPARFKTTSPIEEVSLEDYDAMFVPGGLAPVVDMPDNPTVQSIIRTMWESGKIVSSVCHGPVSLINVKLSDGSWLVDGKNVTGFSSAEEAGYAKDDVPWELEDKLIEHGAIFSRVSPWQPHSVTDGRLITGQNPASAQGVAERVIAALEGSEVSVAAKTI
jgi:putative intracellular protease/amidase